MTTKIGIIDYQMGNLRSVQKGFEKVGISAEIFSDPNLVKNYDKIVLPGVGAFRDAISELNSRGFADPIREWVNADKPLLGICLGLQLLFERSFEDGEHQGFGLIEGDVVRFDIDPSLKVPHMGWNQLIRSENCQSYPHIGSNTYFYFVHSYHVRPRDTRVIAFEAEYGYRFCAAVQRGNLFATQFHPEKSQTDGLKLLKEFAEGKPGDILMRPVSSCSRDPQ